MKKFNLSLMSLFFIVFIIFFYFEIDAYATETESVVLHEGQSVFLKKEYLNNETTLTSKNSEVASVFNGIITANLEGETTCVATKKYAEGNKIEKIYKIKVLPHQEVRNVFTEPNNPKKGENLLIFAVTDKAVDKVKFLIYTANNHIEIDSEEKVLSGNVAVHKVSVILSEAGLFKVRLNVQKNGVWKNANNFAFEGKILIESNTVPVERLASDKCVEYIKAKEGFKPALTADSFAKNVYDIGYGVVIKCKEPFYEKLTPIEAHAELINRLNNRIFSRRLNDFALKNNLNFSQNEFDALLSFTYNVGPGWIKNSKLRNVILSIKNTNRIKYKSAIKSIGTVVSDNGLRLREQPNAQSKILTVMKFNEQAKLLSKNNDGWYKVKTKQGQVGYCFAEFLLVNENDYTKSNIAVVNSENGLRLRSEANTISSVISVLKFNDEVEVISKNCNDWYKVKTDSGKIGYCAAPFLTFNSTIKEPYFEKKDLISEVLSYNKAGGAFVRGLMIRRIEELQMFLFRDYSRDGAKNKYGFCLPSEIV